MSDSTKLACPICGSADLSTELQTELFSFGVDEKAVELSAEISVHHCNKCAFSFSDEDASNARHDAKPISSSCSCGSDSGERRDDRRS